LGGKCVFACELDPGARALYRINFGGPECLGDVTAVDSSDIPEHDVLTAGFPCQPFAFCNLANIELTGSNRCGPGLKHASGQGLLALEVARFVHASRPAAFILENVPNLCNFNDGYDFQVILEALRGDTEEAGSSRYIVDHAILDAKDFGVCQQRRRLYIVGFRAPDKIAASTRYTWPTGLVGGCKLCLYDVLEPNDQVPMDCQISAENWQKIMKQTGGKVALLSGRGGHIARLNGYARTLTSSYRTTHRFSEFVPHPARPQKIGEEAGKSPHATTKFLHTERMCKTSRISRGFSAGGTII